MSEHEFLPPGALLVAAPSMLDRNFMHSVVMVVQHNPQGALGFVLNQGTGQLTTDLLDEDSPLGQDPLPVRTGGPVSQTHLQFLHRRPELLPGGLQVVGGLHLGGDLDALQPKGLRLASLAGDLRLYLGYSGWGAGQLELELAEGGWLPLEPRPDLVFDADEREPTWRRVLRSLGDYGVGLSLEPPDPSWN